MRVAELIKTALVELVSLIVDDTVTFVGAAIALVATFVVAHEVTGLRHEAGFGLFALVWISLAISFRRAVVTARAEQRQDD